MGLLTPAERRTLIELLLKLPNISDQAVRRILLTGLPNGLIQNVNFSAITYADLNAILDTADGDAWAKMPDGSWSVLVVVDNAVALVVGTLLEQELRALRTALQNRADQTAAPQPVSQPQPAASGVVPATAVPPDAVHLDRPAPSQLTELSGAQFKELVSALTSAFPSIDDLRQLVRYGLDERLNEITGQAQIMNAAFELVEWAIAQGRIQELVIAARDRVPRNPKLRAFVETYLEGSAFIAPPDSAEPAGIVVERIVNSASTFADYDTWVSRASEVAPTICRVEIPEPNGTGFLVGKDLVITNHHVIDSLIGNDHKLAGVTLRFDYQVDAVGNEIRESVPYKLAANPVLVKSPFAELDFVLLRVAGSPGTDPIGGQAGAPQRGWLTPVARTFEAGQPLLVVQHPDGMPLKIAIGRVLSSSPRRVRYDVSTLGGSSGAPVFNTQWELAALHHGAGRGDAARFNEGIPLSDILDFDGVRQALEL